MFFADYRPSEFENFTRDAILEHTGFSLKLLFPGRPVSDIVSFHNEKERLSMEYGPENIAGSFVYEAGSLTLGLFVRQQALQKITV